jgi:hypothetical protein
MDDLVLAHTEGHEGNLLVNIQVQSLRMLDPLDGSLNKPAASHTLCHFVPRSGCSMWL